MAWSGYLALGTVTSGVFTELALAGYGRKAFTFSTPAADHIVGSGSNIDFGAVGATAWAYQAYAFYAAVSGGNPILYYPLVSPQAASSGTHCRISPSSIVIDIVGELTAEGIALDAGGVGVVAGVRFATQTGTVGRSVQDYLSEVVDIRSFASGVGAGNAVADTAAMTTAIAYATTNPGTVIYFPTGSYTLTAPALGFSLPNKTTLRGAGMYRTVINWNDTGATPPFCLFQSSGLAPAVVATTAPTTAGSAVITVANGFTSGMAFGALVRNRTNARSASIPYGTTIVAATSTTVTLSTPVVGGGLNTGDVIEFWLRANDIVIEDLQIKGTWATNFLAPNSQGTPLRIDNCDFIRIRHICIDGSRFMGIRTEYSSEVLIDSCVVRYCARDGIAATYCPYVSIVNNHIFHVGDDSINCHSITGDFLTTRKDINISGNIIFDAQGIKVLAARNALISNNVLDCVKVQGIDVSTNPYTLAVEGSSAAYAIAITGNVITNVLNRTPMDGLGGNTCHGIYLSGAASRPGNQVAIPGEFVAATGVNIDPYLWYRTNSNTSTDPVPECFGFIVANNVIARTLPQADGTSATDIVKISDWGYSPQGALTPAGWYNGALSLANMIDYGVRIGNGGAIRDCKVSSNIIRGMQGGVHLANAVKHANVIVDNNLISDYTDSGVLQDTFGAVNVVVRDNQFDADPFNKSGFRVAAAGPGVGQWNTNAGGLPNGIQVNNSISGLRVVSNTFRNVYRVSNLATDGSQQLADFSDNIAEAWPVAIGFHANNRGVGVIDREGGVAIRMIDAAPEDGTGYDSINYPVVRLATAMPTTGRFVQGRFIVNSNPVQATGKVLLGWVRLTTGGNNVLNTDWSAVYGTTT